MMTLKTTLSRTTGPTRIEDCVSHKAGLIEKAADIKYKHISVIIVWKLDRKTPSYYLMFIRKYGTYIGRTTTLMYLEEGYNAK